MSMVIFHLASVSRQLIWGWTPIHSIGLYCVQTEDVSGSQGLVQEVSIALKGEAYAIHVAVKYPDPATGLLEYGLMKATQTATKSVTLVNTGKYGVAFAFHQRGAMMKELFSIVPAEGNLAPGGQQAVELTLNRSASLPVLQTRDTSNYATVPASSFCMHDFPAKYARTTLTCCLVV